MEYASQANRVDAGLNWFDGLVASVKTRLRKHRAYQDTMAELEALDQRELDDLGLSPSMFRDIARQTAAQA